MARTFFVCMRKSSDEHSVGGMRACMDHMYDSHDDAEAKCPENYEVVELVAMTIPEWEKLIKDTI